MHDWAKQQAPADVWLSCTMPCQYKSILLLDHHMESNRIIKEVPRPAYSNFDMQSDAWTVPEAKPDQQSMWCLQARVGVVVVGATNRPDCVDSALLRPGCFDRLLYVPPPDCVARQAILEVHTRQTPLAADVHLQVCWCCRNHEKKCTVYP